MSQIESSNCMEGITIVHVGKRNFRVPTTSLPTRLSSNNNKDIYVRPYNNDNTNAGSANEEEITLKLNVPFRLCGLIIGKGRYRLKQLTDETKTKITFPYRGPVTIVGTKDRTEMAKKRIEDIIAPHINNAENEKFINDTKIEDTKKDDGESIKESIKDNDEFTIKLNVPGHLHGSIIGWRGNVVKQIMAETRTKIIILRDENLAIISGTKDGAELAKKQIENIIGPQNITENEKPNDTKIEDKKKDDGEPIKESIEEIKFELNVPWYLHRLIIGDGESIIKQIMAETKTRIITRPTRPDENLVTISGSKDGVELAKKQIENIIKPQNNAENEKSNDTNIANDGESIKESIEGNEEITLELVVPGHLHGSIIGRGGNVVKQIKAETKTRITAKSDENIVVISGSKDGVEAAKKRIEYIIGSQNITENEKSNDTKIEDTKKDDGESIKESIKDNEEIIINLNIPGHLHGSIIGRGGSVVKQIRAETKTRITSKSDENIVVISGSKDGIEMARKRIEYIIGPQNDTENEKFNDTRIEYKKKDDGESIKESIKDNEEITQKLSVPGRFHGLIIGKGGSTVKQIMNETKTKISIQKDENSAIISGAKDGIEMATKRIEDIIDSYNNAGYINEERKIEVPQPLHGLIIGKGGGTVKQIMAETYTNIKVQKDENLVIINGTKVGVERAKKQIEGIIESDAIFILPPTHFISLPLTNAHLQRKVEDFKSNVLELNLQDVDKSILINPHSLHITIGTLHLYRKKDVEGAVRLLKGLSENVNKLIGTRALVSILSGLEVMENDIVKSHVLYAKVDEPETQNNTLKKLGEYLIEEFAAAGYLKKENRPLKLHVTLINTRHRDERSASSNNDKHEESNRYPFNAVPILNKFGSMDFGPNRLESIHISKMGEYDENGRHHSEGGIKIA